MLCLYVQAPFAVCRTFTAGWYRPTASFLTPSAAYGLLLNIACIESRLREEDENHDGSVPTSLTRGGLPSIRLALGVPAEITDDRYPSVQTIYQQLHNYPVGNAGKERAEAAHGSKYNITPVRREVLVGLRAVIALDHHTELEDRVRLGLEGKLNAGRYGLPFLGDNSFLIDKIDIRDSIPSCHWFELVSEQSDPRLRERTTRMTILINRADLSQTKSALFAPTLEGLSTIPDAAWVSIESPPVELEPAPRNKGRKS